MNRLSEHGARGTYAKGMMRCALLAVLWLSAGSLSAEQFGLFTYEIVGDTIVITDYPEDATSDVVIPAEIDGKQVTSIGNYAFSRCSGLTSVSIPGSATSIGTNAFSTCTGLTSVSIPGSVTSIGFFAFQGCAGLTSIEVDSQSQNYSSLSGVLLNKNRTVLITCPEGKSGAYSIPGGVTSISEYAISGCTGLTTVIIPESVTEFGTSAFSGCTGLTSVTIPEFVTSISERAFEQCSSLTSVTIPESVISIGDSAFRRCSGLTSVFIPDGVTEIPFSAFRNCTGLISVSIPDSVTSIGERAFRNCTGLTSIFIPDGVTSIGHYAFEDCSGLTSAILIGNAPSTIGANVFENATPTFTIDYLSGSSGFTSPTWNGYPSVMLDALPPPSGLWLLTNGLPLETDLSQDLNGDGVNLLMAYALNLDPNLSLQSSLPEPILGDGTLSLSFYGAREDITYVGQTTTDMKTWTTEGVVLSAILPGGQRTASVALGVGERFMRLVVSE